MTNRAVAALVATAIATAVAVTATIGQWPVQEILVTVAATTWILLVVITATDRIGVHIEQAAARIEQAGDSRHADGVIEGMRRTASSGLRGVN